MTDPQDLLRRMRAASVFVEPPGAMTPLLDALKAVLALHQASPAPKSWGDDAEICEQCGGDEFAPYPCPTAAAIESALRADS